jgi:predicted dehydrogenase
VEKPVTTSMDEMNLLMRHAAGAEAPILVDHIYLFHERFEQLKRDIQLFTKGDFDILTAGGGHGPFRPDYTALWDYGPHDVAMVLDIMRQPVRKVRAEMYAPGIYQLELTFDNGNSRSLFGNGLEPGSRVRKMQVARGVSKLAFHDYEPRPKVAPLQKALQTFVDAIKGTHNERLGLSLALDVTRVLSEAERQIQAAK